MFDDPDAFDITRKPNPHLGFGQGVHYCLGANLARLELRVLFEELLTRFSSVKLVKPVEWTRSNRHTGIRHLVVELRGVRPDVFAAVMATGIVSIAAADHGLHIISDVLIVLAAVAMPVLIVLVARAWRGFDLRDPDVALGLFTYVAACAVVAARLAEHRIVLWVLAGMALQGWLSLAPLAVRGMWQHRWTGLRDRAHGGWELASVATSGLAIVSADLDIVFWAVVFWVLAICVYLLMTGLIVWRVDFVATRQLDPDGRRGHRDAGRRPPSPCAVTRAVRRWCARRDDRDVGGRDAVDPAAGLCDGLRRFAGIGWPTVFPLGMYSSATYAMAVETGWRWFAIISLVFFWIAFTAWLIVAIGLLLRFRRVSRDSATFTPNRERMIARTRCGYSVRSSHVNRNTCQPRSAIAFWRSRSIWKASPSLWKAQPSTSMATFCFGKPDVDLVSADRIVRLPAL